MIDKELNFEGVVLTDALEANPEDMGINLEEDDNMEVEETTSEEDLKEEETQEEDNDPDELLKDLLDEDDEEEEDTEEEDDKPEKKAKVKKKSDEELEDESELINAFAKDLAAKGILAEEDSADIKDYDSLLSNLNNRLEVELNGWKDEYRQNVIANLIADGYIKESDIKVPEDEYTLDSVTASDDAAENFLREYYTLKNIPKRRIENLINNSIDPVEDAKDLYEDYETIKSSQKDEVAQKLKAQEEAQKKAMVEAQKAVAKTITDTKEFIPGQPVTEKIKQKVLGSVTTTLQKIEKDLVKYAPVLSYLNYYGFLDGDFDKLVRAKHSDSINAFTETLRRNKGKSFSNRRSIAKESIKNRIH